MGTVIGLIGLIGSGKGTVGDFLVKDHGFVADSFAKPLKDAAALIFNWPRDMVEGATKESREWREKVDPYWAQALGRPAFTPRLALQWLGTEAGRNVFGKNLWTAALINRLDPAKNYVITDVRFANEVEALKAAGATIVRVVRGNDPRWMEWAEKLLFLESLEPRSHLQEAALLADLPHRSEWDWVKSPIDFVLNNNTSLEDLRSRVTYMLGNVLQKTRV